MPVPLPNQANLRARPHRILLGPPVALQCAQRQRLLARRFMYSVCRPEAAMACSLDISTTGGATPNLQTHLPQRRIRARRCLTARHQQQWSTSRSRHGCVAGHGVLQEPTRKRPSADEQISTSVSEIPRTVP